MSETITNTWTCPDCGRTPDRLHITICEHCGRPLTEDDMIREEGLGLVRETGDWTTFWFVREV